MTDAELLQRFVAENHEAAFSELVRRRIDLVYAAALRQLGGDAHRAEDITQQVFIDLARKARTLTSHPSLLAWLYTSTHYAARKFIRTENRRQRREEEAHAMENLTASSAPADWDQLRPVLDRAMHELSDRERQIVLLRYFDQQSFAAIGTSLGMTENAAQKSADRALDRLHAMLAKRGVTSTASALGVALANQAAATAPAGLAASVTTAALSGAASIGFGSTVILYFMSASKTALTLAAAGVLAVGLAVYQSHQADAARAALESAHREYNGWSARRAALQKEIAAGQSRPTAVASTPAATTPAAANPVEPDRAQQQQALEQELQSAGLKFYQVRFKSENAAYLRSLGATAQQIEQATAAYGQRYQDYVRGSTVSPDKDFPELRAIIGDAAAERWHHNTATGMSSATSIIKDLAAAQFFTNEPFTSEQVDQLAALVMTHYDRKNSRYPTYAGPNPYRLDAVDWDNVVRDAERILSAGQMNSLRALAARGKNANLYAAALKQSSK